MPVRYTSKKAYKEVQDEGIVGKQQKQILDYVKDHSPISRGQIADQTGLRINSVMPRVNELVKRGLLVEDHKGQCTTSSRTVWFLVLDETKFAALKDNDE